MLTIVAKCENCGGALRIAQGADVVECGYCGTTSYVRPPADANAPKLRVDPPPPVESGVRAGVFLTLLMGTFAAALFVIAIFESGGDRVAVIVMGSVLGVATVLALLATRNTKRHYQEQVWFRENAVPGRATVLEIAVTHDGSARLTLELETVGQSARRVEHTTQVPTLLIPRLTQGLALPVVVHPNDPTTLAVQWHLV